MKGLKKNFEDSAFRHEIVEDTNKAHVESDWKDVVDISLKFPEHREKRISVLDKHQQMWDGHLGTIHATKHRIELTPGAHPVHQQPCRAGPT